MKKSMIISLICILVMVGVLGCGSSKEEKKDSQKSETEKETIGATQSDVPLKTVPATKVPEPTTVVTKAPEVTQAPATTVPATKKPETNSKPVKLGSSWKVIEELKYTFPVYAMGFYNDKYAVTVGYGGEIHYTTDAGKNWPQATNKSYCRYGVDIVNDKVSYTCGNAGEVTKSEDGGKTYAQKAKFGDYVPDQCQMLSFCDENNGIIASYKRMAITNDGATTWTELKVPAKILCIYMVTTTEFYFIGSDLNLYKTVDGGSNWETIPMNLPEKNYVINPLNFALYVDGDNAYTIFCIPNTTRVIKSYSTIDNWATFKENTIPELPIFGKFYFNHDGKFLTINNPTDSACTVLKRK